MTIIRSTKALAERSKYDYYRTPRGLAEAALRGAQPSMSRVRVLDPGAGSGIWGSEAAKLWPNAEVTGIEYQPLPKPQGYTHWINTDFMSWDTDAVFDLVVGNPPFNIAEEFIYKSMHHLVPGGLLVFLLRSAFLESRKRYDGLFKTYELVQVLTSVRRVSWTQDGRTDDTSFSVFYWMNTPAGKSHSYIGGWLDWNYKDDDLLLKAGRTHGRTNSPDQGAVDRAAVG